MDEQQLLKIIADLKKTIEDQGLITRRTIIKNSRKNDVNSLKKQLSKFIDNKLSLLIRVCNLLIF